MKKSIYFILLICSSQINNVFGQDWTTDSLRFGRKEFKLELPADHIRNFDRYTEGSWVFYNFPDTSVFTIFYGFNATVTHPDGYDTLWVDGQISYGHTEMKDKFWKTYKDSESLSWGYNRVSKQNLEVFDRIFKSMVVDDISKRLVTGID